MVAESEYVSIPTRLTVGSESFPSTFSELIICSRNPTISWTMTDPMLPDESRTNTMSEPREQSSHNIHNTDDVAYLFYNNGYPFFHVMNL